jgi:hypothetical protein
MKDRRSERGLSAMEIAIGVAIFGSLMAVAVPAFVKELHASRFAEPMDGLAAIARGASERAVGRTTADAFPESAPLTPSTVPHGKREIDPPGAWDTPAWKALGFRPVSEGVAHSFAFSFENQPGPEESRFVAQAHADFDGDNVLSTFEMRGKTAGAPNVTEVIIEPGMHIEAELE